MAQVINAILQPFLAIIHVIESLFIGLVQLITNVVQALHFFDIALQAMPPILYVIALCFIFVSVVYLIIGR